MRYPNNKMNWTNNHRSDLPRELSGGNLAGEAGDLRTITAKKLRKPVPAPIDDTLAERSASIAGGRGHPRQMRQRRLDDLSRMRLKRDLLDQLANGAASNRRPSLTDQEFEQIWKSLEASAPMHDDEDDKGKTDDRVAIRIRGIAERRVRLGLLLGEIGRHHAIQVTPEEITAADPCRAARYPAGSQMSSSIAIPAGDGSVARPDLRGQGRRFVLAARR